MEEIIEIINKKFINEKQKIKKITILLDVYDEKTELVHGILLKEGLVLLKKGKRKLTY